MCSDNFLMVPVSVFDLADVDELASEVCRYGHVAWVRPYDDEARAELIRLSMEDEGPEPAWREDD